MTGNELSNKNAKTVTSEVLEGMMIEDVLTRWPQTAEIFQQYKMACIGCAVASFYSIADAANIYCLPLNSFVQELLKRINLS